MMAALIPFACLAKEEVRGAVDAWAGTAVHGARGTQSSGFMLTHSLDDALYAGGFRLIAGASTGRYRFASADAAGGQVHGRYAEGFAQLGYQWSLGDSSLALAAGPVIRDLNLSYASPDDTRTGSSTGLRSSVTLYSQPSPSLSLLGVVNRSSIEGSAFYLGKLGIRAGNLEFGPEATISSGKDYREGRLGIHISGMQLGPLQLGISAGGTKNKDRQRSQYLGLSARYVY